MMLSETAARVIDLATAIRDYWSTELPKRHPNYPVVAPGEDSGPPPPEETDLKNLLEKLPDEEVYELILLMYLGRGDFAVGDLAKHYRTLRERFCKRESAIAQMEGQAALADYLADGVAELQKKGIDLDHLTLMSVGSGS